MKKPIFYSLVAVAITMSNSVWAEFDFFGLVKPKQAIPQQQLLRPNPGLPVAAHDIGNAIPIKEFETQPRLDMPVTVTATTWTDENERAFDRFVQTFGRAVSKGKCNTVKRCMQNPEANVYAKTDPQGFIMYSDCADLPYMLRTYFAYKNQLPFSVVSRTEMSQQPYASLPREIDLASKNQDNSPYGNVIMARGNSDVASTPGREPNFIEYWSRVMDSVWTATFRVGPLTPGYDKADVYPVKMSRETIRPGTLVHTTGHLYVVFDVDSTGQIHVVDAHPDGSITGKKVITSSTLDRSRPDQGLGFYRFRPLRLIGAHVIQGAYYGGSIVPASDNELYQKGLFSLEQWFGPGSNVAPHSQVNSTLWADGFKKMDFFAVLNIRMRGANVTVSADEDVGSLMSGLCNEIRQRVEDVDKALSPEVAMNTQAHVEALPQNIYSASGPWEDYSTPSRDSRMKAAAQSIITDAIVKFKQAKAGGFGLTYKGSAENYQSALRTRLAAMDKKCVIQYTNSAGNKVSLGFSQVVLRLNRLSADPYHCAERRWGAGGTELATCKDQDTGGQWYDAEKYIRNMAGKTDPSDPDILTIRSDRPITLQMLQDPRLIDQPSHSPINLGSSKIPVMKLDADFASKRFLDALNGTLMSM